MSKSYKGWLCPECSKPNMFDENKNTRCQHCLHVLDQHEKEQIARAMSQVMKKKLDGILDSLNSPRMANALELLELDREVEPMLETGPQDTPVGWEWFEETLGREFLPADLRGESK